jgi:hypothetical protein
VVLSLGDVVWGTFIDFFRLIPVGPRLIPMWHSNAVVCFGCLSKRAMLVFAAGHKWVQFGMWIFEPHLENVE